MNVSADLEKLLRQVEAQTEEAVPFLANHPILDTIAGGPLPPFVYFGAIEQKARIHPPVLPLVPMRLNSRQ